MALNAPPVGSEGGRLLGTVLLPKDQPLLGRSQVGPAQLLDGLRLAIGGMLSNRVFPLGPIGKPFLRFDTRLFRC
jgi:hypothetical protein